MVTPTIDRDRAKAIFHDGKTVFYNKVVGIREQIKKGRYGRYALIDGGKIRVSYPVYYDYSLYRDMLENKNTAKMVPPFSANEVEDVSPYRIK